VAIEAIAERASRIKARFIAAAILLFPKSQLALTLL
jgi:hypothetical protein